jgi:hypothetical protein
MSRKSRSSEERTFGPLCGEDFWSALSRGHLVRSVEAGGGSACGEKQSLKIDRASGECLGAVCRGRTCQAAIRGRELQAGFDLPISEWGNPAGVTTRHHTQVWGARGELKHLSTLRKRKQT